MNQDVLLRELISWVPMLLLIGVWIYFMRRYSGGTTSTNQKVLAEYQRHNELMEKVIERMDLRISRLEERDAKSK